MRYCQAWTVQGHRCPRIARWILDTPHPGEENEDKPQEKRYYCKQHAFEYPRLGNLHPIEEVNDD